jgi:TonB family protein
MAHQPTFGTDPATPDLSATERRVEGGVLPAERAGELDLGKLAAKFAVHGGGRVSAELSTDLALDVVLNEIVEQACLATGASGAAIVLERDGEWVCRASAGASAPQLGARLNAEAGLSGACVKTRTWQRCDDAQADPRADIEASRSLGVRSVIILPLLQNDRLAGIFEVFSSRPSAFAERDELTLEALSQRVLKNLARAAEPLPAEASPDEVVPAKGTSAAADSIIAGDVSAGNNGTASDGHSRLSESPLLQPTDGAAVGRVINVITWILGALVFAVAILLTVRVVQRLGGGRAAGRVNPPAVASSLSSDAANLAENRIGGSAGSAASGNKTVEPGASPSGSAVPGSRATHPADSSSPAGSLSVYENGKEVYRMPSNVAQGGQTSPAMEAASVLEVPAAVAEGSLLYRVEPEYPEQARQQQLQGAVVLELRAGRDGAIQEIRLVSGEPLLAGSAIAAVKQWRFKPLVVNGQAVEMETKVTLNFRLPH